MSIYLYRIRPGYGSDKLLIEFISSPENEGFSEVLKSLFKDCNINIIKKENSFDDIVYDLLSSYGSFEMSIDSWGGVFIHADENQDFINYLDGKLSASKFFEKQEVDFSRYQSKEGDKQ